MTQSFKSLGPHPDFPYCQVVCNEQEDFCHTQPYPTSSQLADYYQSEYREVRQESPTPDYVRFMDHRAKEQLRFILDQSGRSAFSAALDIGCGAGRLVNALAANAKSVRGYEADDAMAAFAQSHRAGDHIEIVNQLFNPERPQVRTDLITLSHVFEHVPDPGSFLTSLRTNTLAPGGILFLEVPNDPAHWVKKQIEWKLRGLGHLNYFTEKSLRNALKSSGFQVLGVRSCGQPLENVINERKPKSFISRKLTRLTKPVEIPYRTLPSYEISRAQKECVYLQAVATIPMN